MTWLLPLLVIPALLAVVAFHMVVPNTRVLRVSMAAILPDPPQSDAPRHRFSITALIASFRFWLRITVIVLLGFALYPFLISRPPPGGDGAYVRIVLDQSPSMGLTLADGSTRYDVANAVYDKILLAVEQQSSDSAQFCMDVARVDGTLAVRVSNADGYDPASEAPGDTGMPANALVATLSQSVQMGCDGRVSHAVIITDQPPRPVSPDEFDGHLAWYQVGEPVANIALVDLSLRGGGLGSGTSDAEILLRAENFGPTPATVVAQVAHPGGTSEIVFRQNEDGGGGWTGSLPFSGAGTYLAWLSDGGSYGGDDRLAALLPEIDQVTVDWRITSLRQPNSLTSAASTEGGILVAEYNPDLPLPEGPFVLVYDGWPGSPSDEIGPFLDDSPILENVNFDVLETNAPVGFDIRDANATNLVAVVRGQEKTWIGQRNSPPGVIVPFAARPEGEAGRLSRVLLANALRFASGTAAEATIAVAHVDENANLVSGPLFEADTFRAVLEAPDLDLFLALPRNTAGAEREEDINQDIPLAPWLIALALGLVLLERVLGPTWSRRSLA